MWEQSGTENQNLTRGMEYRSDNFKNPTLFIKLYNKDVMEEEDSDEENDPKD